MPLELHPSIRTGYDIACMTATIIARTICIPADKKGSAPIKVELARKDRHIFGCIQRFGKIIHKGISGMLTKLKRISAILDNINIGKHQITLTKYKLARKLITPNIIIRMPQTTNSNIIGIKHIKSVTGSISYFTSLFT
jgi:hypothetical protein